jgi:ABC-type antimicrobial peptide transport system permease subunit
VTNTEVGLITSFMSSLKMLFTIAKILCVIVLITKTLVAANTAATSVRERHREVAIVRAFEFARESILGMLIGESLLVIAIAGGMLGCLVAYLALWRADIGREILGPFGATRMPLIVALYGITGSAMIDFASASMSVFQMVRHDILIC